MTDDNFLIFAFSITADGARPMEWDEVQNNPYPAEGEKRWYHINRLSQAGKLWLEEAVLMPAFVRAALFQEETRPRAFTYEDGLVLNLRGVNMSQGAEPEDLISLRIYATDRVLITMRSKNIRAGDDLRVRLTKGYIPASIGEMVAFLTHRMTELLEPVVQRLEDEVDRLEDDMLNDKTPPPKLELAGFRRAVLSLRRYIMPQREAVSDLGRIGEPLISRENQLQLRETQDVVTRLSEHLDMIRERATVIQEQIVELRAEDMNQRLFVLAIISAIFLPLGFITGLFGVNVGGVPGVENGLSFWALCAGMVVLTGVLLFLFRKMKWL